MKLNCLILGIIILVQQFFMKIQILFLVEVFNKNIRHSFVGKIFTRGCFGINKDNVFYNVFS